MSKNLEMKKQVVEEIKGKLDKAASIVVVDYRGLTAEEATELRDHLRAEEVEFKIYKNTMLKFAMEDEAYAQMKELLEGPTAVAFSYDDPTSAARRLNDIAKKYEALEFKAGIVEGMFYDANTIKEIAEIPSRDVLISKLLGSLQSSITNFARVIKQVAEKGGEVVVEEVKEEAPVAPEVKAPEAPAAEEVKAEETTEEA